MQTIELETRIAAPAMRVFLLSLSVDLHLESTNHTHEQAIAGVTQGILQQGDEVTWQARHFGFTLQHATKITAYDAPHSFQDAMTRGLFKWFEHDHFFTEENGATTMRDVLRFSAPFGPLGWIAEHLALSSHLRNLLLHHNKLICEIAESDKWQHFLP